MSTTPFSDGWYSGAVFVGGLWALVVSPPGNWGVPLGVAGIVLGGASGILGWYAQYLRAKYERLYGPLPRRDPP